MTEIDATPPVMDIRTFWSAIGVRATGVAIVTAKAEDGPRGFLALSPTHLSADPPMIMLSVDRKTTALGTIEQAGHLAINYLGADQAELTGPFGGKGDLKGADRFQLGHWTTLSTGAPVLEGAAGVLDCRVEEMIERFGTVIVIARLVDFSPAGDIRPLVWFGGKAL